MKALHFSTYSPPAVLTIKESPKPEPRKGEVVVQIKATAINPSDVKNVAGDFKSPLPRVPGRDYAGVVVAGDAEKGLEVWGSGAGFGMACDGAQGEYIVVPAEWISQKPPKLSMEQAAAIGVPYVAAWSALVRVANIQAGETVLIVGVLRCRGQRGHTNRTLEEGACDWRVHNSGNPSKADELINTTTHDLDLEVRALTDRKGADLVLDAVGGPCLNPL